MVPSPWPAFPEAISIQDDCGAAVQPHSRATLTLTEPVPPFAPKLDAVFLNVIAQRVLAGEGPVTLVTLVVAELPHAAVTRAAAQANGRGRRTCTLIRMHFAHQLHKRIRPRSELVLGVLLPILSVLGSSCVSSVPLVRDIASPPCAAIGETVEWLRIPRADERRRSDRWCAAVGPPAVLRGASTKPAVDRFIVVSWNVHVGGGNIRALVSDLRTGRLTGGRPADAFVLLLQEVYRSGDGVPGDLPADAQFARAVRAGGADRMDVASAARALHLSLFYAPSMRNGSPNVSDEDRGSAILSTLPLDGLTAIELPLEHQRRIVVAASIHGRSREGNWMLRVVSAHFTNAVGHHLWLLSESARVRHALALAEALEPDAPTVLGGDFNTWFGYQDGAYKVLARRFPSGRPEDRRPTFSVMRLDHVFYRLPDGWSATVRRAESRYGSDHYPLIAELTVP
jgi:endonuclease/exonuclease/phosphatase family metal-dependent hydrolase